MPQRLNNKHVLALRWLYSRAGQNTVGLRDRGELQLIFQFPDAAIQYVCQPVLVFRPGVGRQFAVHRVTRGAVVRSLYEKISSYYYNQEVVLLAAFSS